MFKRRSCLIYLFIITNGMNGKDMKSASNRQLKLLRKLNKKKHRYREQLFLIEGARAVRQVADNKALKIKTLLFDRSQGYHTEEEWQRRAEGPGAALLDAGTFAELSDTDTPQGVLALCHMPEETPIDIIRAVRPPLVALDAIQDPGNVGTIIRTAGWFGAGGILSGKGTVDLFHPKVVRSTAGATGALPYCNGNLASLLGVLEEDGWRVLLLNKSSQSVPLGTEEEAAKTVLVVGNEAHGIDPDLMEGRPQVEIPSATVPPPVESLNAAIAVSVALYEITSKHSGSKNPK